MAVFVDTIEPLRPLVILNFGNNDYHGFVLAHHAPNAIQNEILIRPIKGIADCFPVLSDQSMVFRTFPMDLDKFLKDESLREHLLTNNNNNMHDSLKILIRTLGLLALYCFVRKVKLDLNLKRLYITDFLQLKAIALEGFVDDFTQWKEDLVALYKDIEDACFDPSKTKDWEFEKFIQLLQGSSTPREVESLLNSVLFWNKCKRMSVLRKVGDLVKTTPCRFLTKSDEPTKEILSGWRNTMSTCPKTQALINAHAPKDILTTPSLAVDQLLVFLRNTFGHFSSASKSSGIESECELLTHYDSSFPRIMYGVYTGCERMEALNLYKFDLGKL